MSLRRIFPLLITLVAPSAIAAGIKTADAPELNYELVSDWPQLPEGWNFGPTTGVGVDSKNNVYVYHRGPHPIMCFSADGTFLRSWGDGIISGPHGLAVDRDDNVWVTDIGAHTVVKFTPKGRVLMVLGQKGTATETETTFNMPTHVAFGPSDEIYVSDGYGNSRIVKFSSDGRYLTAWGKKGKAAGEFDAPHSLAIDAQGQVYVGDRENYRVQIFDPNGKFISEWTHLGSPWGLYLGSDGYLYMSDGYNDRVSKLNLQGQLLGTFGKQGRAPGELYFAHHISLGKNGEIYVAEVQNWRVSKFVPK